MVVRIQSLTFLANSEILPLILLMMIINKHVPVKTSVLAPQEIVVPELLISVSPPNQAMKLSFNFYPFDGIIRIVAIKF